METDDKDNNDCQLEVSIFAASYEQETVTVTAGAIYRPDMLFD